MNLFPPSQGLKSGDKPFVHAIQFLTAVYKIIVGARDVVPLRVAILFVAQV